jgi:ribosomal protein L37AE/L43A
MRDANNKKLKCKLCKKNYKKDHKKRGLWGDIAINFSNNRSYSFWICNQCYHNLINAALEDMYEI